MRSRYAAAPLEKHRLDARRLEGHDPSVRSPDLREREVLDIMPSPEVQMRRPRPSAMSLTLWSECKEARLASRTQR